MSLTYGSLQVLPWNNDTTTEKTDGCNWRCQITDFFQHIHHWNQESIIVNKYNNIKNYNKHSKFEKCAAAFALLFCYSSNGWLQMKLKINSISLKKGMTASACFKETHLKIPWKILGHSKRPEWLYQSNLWLQVLLWNNVIRLK